MTMDELSQEYATSAAAVQQRIAHLRRASLCAKTPEERHNLQRRILALQPLYRDAREVSVITQNYYKRRSRRRENITKL